MNNDNDHPSGLEPASSQLVIAPPTEPIPSHFHDRTDWWSFGIAALLAFSVYLFTLTPEVQLNNAGVFVTAAKYGGVGQPPGFPVWTIYAWLFTKLLPFSNFAWRVSVSSAFAAAIACGLIALMVSRGAAMIGEGFRGYGRLKPKAENSLRVVCGCVAGMAFGFDGCIWERAVGPDPWPLTLLLFAMVLALLMRWSFAPIRLCYLYAAMLVYGLGLTNSQSLTAAAPAIALLILLENHQLGRDIFATVALLFAGAFIFRACGILSDEIFLGIQFYYLWQDFDYLWPMYAATAICSALISIGLVFKTRRLFTSWKPVCAAAIILVLGYSAVLFLPLASMTNAPMNWGYPRTVDGFWHVLSRGQYEKFLPTDVIHEPGIFLMQLGIYWKIAFANFGPIFVVLAGLPFCFLHRMRIAERKWIFALLGIFLWLSVFMAMMLNQSNDRTSMEMSKIFFAASHLVLAIFAGYGLAVLGIFIHAKRLHPDSPAAATLPE